LGSSFWTRMEGCVNAGLYLLRGAGSQRLPGSNRRKRDKHRIGFDLRGRLDCAWQSGGERTGVNLECKSRLSGEDQIEGRGKRGYNVLGSRGTLNRKSVGVSELHAGANPREKKGAAGWTALLMNASAMETRNAKGPVIGRYLAGGLL